MTEVNVKEFKKDYLNGLKYKELMDKYNITQPELQKLIRHNKLTRTKSQAQIGNKNSVGNNGGAKENNKNAVTTGEYETIFKDVLTEEELEVYNIVDFQDNRMLLLDEYRILTVREKRMMARINKLQNKDKDLTIGSIRKRETRRKASVETKTVTEAESTISLIQKIEEGLTRVQDAKRKCLETLQKLDNENDNTLNLNVSAVNPILESINRQLGGGLNGRK